MGNLHIHNKHARRVTEGMCWRMRHVLLTKGVDAPVQGDCAPIFRPGRSYDG